MYDLDSGLIQVVGGLPRDPRFVAELQAQGIPGVATDIAISDDGTVALLKSVQPEGPALWVVDSAGIPRRVPVEWPSAAAFFPNRKDAIVTDGVARIAFHVVNIDRETTPVPVVSGVDDIDGFSSISVADDSRRVFFAGRSSGLITIVDLNAGTLSQVSCHCRPTGLFRLSGESVYRMTDASPEPITVLDASIDEPRVVLVPPDISEPAQPQ
jgi:hypothetical protein